MANINLGIFVLIAIVVAQATWVQSKDPLIQGCGPQGGGGCPAQGGGGCPGGSCPAQGGGGCPGGSCPAQGGGGCPGGSCPAQGGGGCPGGSCPAQGGGGCPGGSCPAQGGGTCPAQGGGSCPGGGCPAQGGGSCPGCPAQGGSTDAKEYIVGDDKYWTTGVDYAAWAKDKEFYVGDIIVFNYCPRIHNVVVVDEAGYNACSAEKPLMEIQQTVHLKLKMAVAGTFGIISTMEQDCQNGMKLLITVKEKNKLN